MYNLVGQDINTRQWCSDDLWAWLRECDLCKRTFFPTREGFAITEYSFHCIPCSQPALDIVRVMKILQP